MQLEATVHCLWYNKNCSSRFPIVHDEQPVAVSLETWSHIYFELKVWKRRSQQEYRPIPAERLEIALSSVDARPRTAFLKVWNAPHPIMWTFKVLYIQLGEHIISALNSIGEYTGVKADRRNHCKRWQTSCSFCVIMSCYLRGIPMIDQQAYNIFIMCM